MIWIEKSLQRSEAREEVHRAGRDNGRARGGRIDAGFRQLGKRDTLDFISRALHADDHRNGQPFTPDYFQTIISLCEVIRQLYICLGKFFNPSTSSNPYNHPNVSETPTIRSMTGRPPMPSSGSASGGTSNFSGSTLVDSQHQPFGLGLGSHHLSPKGISFGLKGRNVSGAAAGPAGLGFGAGGALGHRGGGAWTMGTGDQVMRADARLKVSCALLDWRRFIGLAPANETEHNVCV